MSPPIRAKPETYRPAGSPSAKVEVLVRLDPNDLSLQNITLYGPSDRLC